MMRLPSFRYFAPSDLLDVPKILADYGQEAMVVAGGTDLYPNMKRRQFEPKALIGLRKLTALRSIHQSQDQSISIGAGVTLTQLLNDPLIQKAYPSLASCASVISTPQLRNMGTIGGNLCLDTRCNYYDQSHFWRSSVDFCMKKEGSICLVAPSSSRCWAVSSTDSAPVVVALGAKLKLIGPEGERVIEAKDFFREDGISYLNKAHEEVLTEIILPPSDGQKSIYLKLRRRESFDFPVLGVAVWIKQDGTGRCSDAKIVIGGLVSAPLQMEQAQQQLIGQDLGQALIEQIAQSIYKPSIAMDNTDMIPLYRKQMARVFVKRALMALAE